MTGNLWLARNRTFHGCDQAFLLKFLRGTNRVLREDFPMPTGLSLSFYNVSVTQDGTAYDDDFYANSYLSCAFYGYGGNDILSVFSGNHFIDGGEGDDRLYAQDGWTTLLGGAGNDSIAFANGGGTADGGLGDDTIYAHHAQGTIYGGEGNDIVGVSDGQFRIESGTGADVIEAYRSANDIYGGAGNDTITVSEGNNTVRGEDGDDTITVSWGNNAVYGGDGSDTITASTGNNLIDAGAGDDVIVCLNGEALVLAGAGNDRIEVGAGNTTINAGDGADWIVLGYDTQTLRFETLDGEIDTVLRFNYGQDRLEFSGSLFAGLTSGKLAAEYFAREEADAAHGQFVYSSQTGILSWDADGNGAGAAQQITKLYGVLWLASSDIMIV